MAVTVELKEVLPYLGTLAAAILAVFGFCIKIAMEVAVIKFKVETIWPLTTARLANALHQPHPEYARMDDLTQELKAIFEENPRTFDDEKLNELITRLHDCYERVKYGGPEYEKVTALPKESLERRLHMVELKTLEMQCIFGMDALDHEKKDREFRSAPLWKKLLLSYRYLSS